jgi:hypothetical protein
MSKKLAVFAVAAATVLATSAFAQDRVSTSTKGSLLWFPKIELRFDAGGNLKQDAFIQLSNDFTTDVHLVTFYVLEDCTRFYIDIDLTKNQPVFWSVATGQPYGVAPLTVIRAPYPDPEGSGDLVLRGFYVAFAANQQNRQIRWNHLTGLLTAVNYAQGHAYEYAPYSFQALQGNNGDPVGTAGQIKLDGVEYSIPFNRLQLDFQASGSTGFSGGGRIVTHDTDVTLVLAFLDLRQDRYYYRTKAKYFIWNAEEISYAAEYCIQCWSQRLLSNVGGIFLVENLQTANGRAQIDGEFSTVCAVNPPNPQIINTASPLLGLAVKVLTFDNNDVTTAGETLSGQGSEAGFILYDIPEPPEEQVPDAPKGVNSLGAFRR